MIATVECRPDGGVPPRLKARQERLIRDIKALAGGSEVAPSSTNCVAIARQAQRVFGSYANLCHAAGLVTPYEYARYKRLGEIQPSRVNQFRVPPPPDCKPAARLIELACRFVLKHNIETDGGGETLLRVMRAMREEGI